MNDATLVDGLRRRDPAAVRYLHETCLPALWRFVYVRVKADRHLAEDIVSEGVLALLRAAAEPASEIGHPLSWLRTVVAHKIADHFRAAARVQHLIAAAQSTPSVTPESDGLMQQEQLERRVDVRKILEALPEECRLALEWKYLDKVSVREIGDRLGITEKAAESVLFRSRREFRERLQRQQAQDEQPIPRKAAGTAERPPGHRLPEQDAMLSVARQKLATD